MSVTLYPLFSPDPCWVEKRNVELGSFVLIFGIRSASSLGMMSDEEKRVQRIEDIKELLS